MNIYGMKGGEGHATAALDPKACGPLLRGREYAALSKA